MRFIGYTLVGLAASISSSAWAEDGRTYVGVDAGMTLPSHFGLDAFQPLSDVDRFQIHNKAGVDLDLVVGHDFGQLRLEGEIAWKRLPAKSASTEDNETGPLEGHTSSFSGMVNALFVVPAGGFSLFAGPGIGISHNRFRLDNGDGELTKSSDRFAWQVQGGAEIPVSDNASISVKYRYFDTKMRFDDADTNPTDTNDYHVNLHSHSVLAGVRFRF